MPDDVRVIHGDCLDVLPTLAGHEIAAVVTDPPWGINYKSGHNSARRGEWAGWVRDDNFAPILGDDVPFNPRPWIDYPRVVLFGANNFAHLLPPSRGWMVWDKLGGLEPASGSDCELIWTNLNQPVRMKTHLWRGLIRAGAENVAKGPKCHPHQKPVALLVWIIEQLGIPPGKTILDPYAGSGSTGVACLKTGHRCILIEKDERYIPIIRRRLAEAATPLFDALA